MRHVTLTVTGSAHPSAIPWLEEQATKLERRLPDVGFQDVEVELEVAEVGQPAEGSEENVSAEATAEDGDEGGQEEDGGEEDAEE